MDKFLRDVQPGVSDMMTQSSVNATTSEVCMDFPYDMAWWLKAVYLTVFAAMVLVAAGGNFIVIWIVLAHQHMRSVTNFFLVNLAVADALISITNTPFNSFYMVLNYWPFGMAYCKVSTTLSNATIAASTFTFMAIAIERFVDHLYCSS